MDNYNKKVGSKNGTLVANWHEERAMRDYTGEGRATMKEHIPKKWGDLENPITHDKVFDDSHARIHGEVIHADYDPINKTYGKEKNPVDEMPKIGGRQEIIEANIKKKIDEDLAEENKEKERIRNARCWETTTGESFKPVDLTANTIGKKVMKTRDGACIPLDKSCLLYTSPSPRDATLSRMPSSA
eukprot:TRINITY_DN3468_c0_g1_i3.p2 TRINITY_DN3468_c0_g1~~TRINITY_DN3468_c0_g1_i3.p2  ORF type:complete len:186 (-),score=63.37 TRINITY_DN3468_c0_g1_i3:11-568(-)